MQEYTITWTITLDAPSPEAAAEMAREIQLDTASLATHFDVVDTATGETKHVELEVSQPARATHGRTCILTGEPGENPDDCTTHEHTT